MGVFKIPKYGDDRLSMVIDYLGKAISDEWLAHLQYWVGSVIVIEDGITLKKEMFIRNKIIPELRQHSNDEYDHATILSEHFYEYVTSSRIPLSMEEILSRKECGYIKPKSSKCSEIIRDSIRGEMCAIGFYNKFLDEIEGREHVDLVLRDDIMRILKKEEEHLKDLKSLVREYEIKM
jgi:bacterioferritin